MEDRAVPELEFVFHGAVLHLPRLHMVPEHGEKRGGTTQMVVSQVGQRPAEKIDLNAGDFDAPADRGSAKQK